MRSVLVRDGEIVVEERPRPEPGPGEVLVKSRACGICGSDLHIAHHGEDLERLAERAGQTLARDGSFAISLGHEFVAEIVEFGPDTRQTLPVGQRICSLPFLIGSDGQKGIGVEPDVAGAYSEYFLCSEPLLIPIADHVPDEAAALVEPLAVGIHAVARAGRGPDQAALVVGCGPIGLATIAALRLQGVDTIVACDPVPMRRELGLKTGATEAVDSADGRDLSRVTELARERPVVVYECVGRPFIVSQLIERAPAKTTIVFVGICTEEVSILPFIAMQKELDLRFAFYYAPEDFDAAVAAIADGVLDWKLWVTGKVGIDGVAEAFDVLSAPNDHVKVLVEPWRDGGLR